MNKRRINFYYCASSKENEQTNIAILMEAVLAINGIKAVGYTEPTHDNSPYDWEMQQKGAAESVIKACDMVLFDNFNANNEADKKTLQEARCWNVPVYVFRGNAINGINSFNDCIAYCNKLLGREITRKPIQID